MKTGSACYNKPTLLSLLAVAALLLAGCGSSRRAVKDKKGERPGDRTEKIDRKPVSKSGQALVREARKWRGVPYKYGGHSRSGADCSGFLMEVFREAVGIKLPRSSRDQKEYCRPVRRDEMIVGDLVFFTSKNSKGKIAHVGMYIGDNRMIHASSSRGVVEDDLSLRYYVEHFNGVGRVPGLDRSHSTSRTDADAPQPAVRSKASQKEDPQKKNSKKENPQKGNPQKSKKKPTATKSSKNQKQTQATKPQKNGTPVPTTPVPGNVRSVPLDSLQNLFRRDTVPQLSRDTVPQVRRDTVPQVHRDSTTVTVVKNAFRKTQ